MYNIPKVFTGKESRNNNTRLWQRTIIIKFKLGAFLLVGELLKFLFKGIKATLTNGGGMLVIIFGIYFHHSIGV